jgi:hypothetical protein
MIDVRQVSRPVFQAMQALLDPGLFAVEGDRIAWHNHQ